MSSLADCLTKALADGKLLPTAQANIEARLAASSDTLVPLVIAELAGNSE